MKDASEQDVQIVRTVRFGRLLIVGAFAGAVIGVLATLSFPVAESSLYTMGQIAGFMLVVGAVVGLALGGILGLILNVFARKKLGHGKAVHIEVHTDTQVREEKNIKNSAAVDTDVQ